MSLFIPKPGDKFFYDGHEYRTTQPIGNDGNIWGKKLKPTSGTADDIRVPAADVAFEVESDVKKTTKLII